jgi:hypothetical protein
MGEAMDPRWSADSATASYLRLPWHTLLLHLPKEVRVCKTTPQPNSSKKRTAQSLQTSSASPRSYRSAQMQETLLSALWCCHIVTNYAAEHKQMDLKLCDVKMSHTKGTMVMMSAVFPNGLGYPLSSFCQETDNLLECPLSCHVRYATALPSHPKTLKHPNIAALIGNSTDIHQAWEAAFLCYSSPGHTCHRNNQASKLTTCSIGTCSLWTISVPAW